MSAPDEIAWHRCSKFVIALLLIVSQVSSRRIRQGSRLAFDIEFEVQAERGNSTEDECTALGIGAVHRNWAQLKARKCRCLKEDGMTLSPECGPLQGQYKFSSKNPNLKLPGCKCVSSEQPRQMTPGSKLRDMDPVVGHLLVKGKLAQVHKNEAVGEAYYFTLHWEKVVVAEGSYVKVDKGDSNQATASADLNWCAVNWTCPSANTAWKKQSFIKSGSYGAVWIVQQGPYGDNAAIKMPLLNCDEQELINESISDSECNEDRQDGCEDIREEALKILQIKSDLKALGDVDDTCESSIMNVKDAAPCVFDESSDPNPAAGSYVMPLMSGDLGHFFKRASRELKSKCFPYIMETVAIKLRCLHRSGWVHADMKDGNVLYNGVWDHGIHEGCPRDIRIADFGMSGRIGSQTNQFSENSYRSYNYVVSDMFFIHPWAVREGYDHVLGLANGAGKFTYQPALDWCAFHFTFEDWWGATYRNPYWSGDCGMMGYKRELRTYIVEAR